MTTLFRVLKISAVNFIRNSWVNVTAILIMFLVAMSVTLFSLVGISLNQTIRDIEGKADVSVFLKDGLSSDAIAKFQQEIASNLAVGKDGVHFVSKEEALAIFSGKNTGIEIAPEDNPLPASFEIKATNPVLLADVVTSMKNNPAIEVNGIKFNKEAIEKISYWANVLRNVGLSLIAVLCLISFFVILNTIRLALYSRKEEIEIMKLVGATDWFIRWPFIFESAYSGMVAGLLSGVVFLISFEFINAQLATLFRIQPLALDITFLLQVFCGQLLIGALFGAFSSFIGTRNFLKV